MIYFNVPGVANFVARDAWERFWGANGAQLQQIASKYDPHGLLRPRPVALEQGPDLLSLLTKLGISGTL